jgi:hypothetical protein
VRPGRVPLTIWRFELPCAPMGRSAKRAGFPLSTDMGCIWARAGHTPRQNKKLQKSVKKVTKRLQFGNKKLCENFNNVHNLFTKNLQKIHNFCRGAQKNCIFGKKICAI